MKKILTIITVVFALAIFVSSIKAAPPTDLVGWWKLDGNAEDSSTYFLTSTNHGVTYISSPIGQAGDFSGAGRYIEVNDSADLYLDNVTLEAWVKGGLQGSYKYIAGKTYSGGHGSYNLYTGSTGGIYFYIGYSGGYILSPNGGTGIWNNVWHHIAGTFDGLTVKLFIDGIQVNGGTSTTQNIANNTNNFYIGSYGTGNDFNGFIDDVRLWRKALAPNELMDNDFDGVHDNIDKCPDTIADNFSSFGNSNGRYMWSGSAWMSTDKGAKKFQPNMANTYGCSCTQILEKMVIATEQDFGGHYKYGCSKSILDDWNSGKYHIGPTLVETVTVPANSSTGVSSVAALEAGKDYFLKAYGTACAEENTPGTCTIFFDAEYANRPSVDETNWVDGVTGYESWTTNLLDLKVDGNFVNWGAYNTEHTYQIPYSGTGNVLFVTYDVPSAYYNNTGSLSVDIIEDKWVNLW